MIRNAERQIMGLQESIKSGKMKRSAEERKTLERIKSEIVETLGVPLERHVPAPAVGSRVKVETLGREGVVKAISDAGRVEVAIGNMTLRADPEDLILLGPYALQKSSSKNRRIGVDMPLTTPRWEVNVIGLRVEDALPIIDKALDDALLGGLSSVNIIHGKGTGRLKKAIWEHLSGHAFVRDLQAGDIHAGGAGVTVVMLASN